MKSGKLIFILFGIVLLLSGCDQEKKKTYYTYKSLARADSDMRHWFDENKDSLVKIRQMMIDDNLMNMDPRLIADTGWTIECNEVGITHDGFKLVKLLLTSRRHEYQKLLEKAKVKDIECTKYGDMYIRRDIGTLVTKGKMKEQPPKAKWIKEVPIISQRVKVRSREYFALLEKMHRVRLDDDWIYFLNCDPMFPPPPLNVRWSKAAIKDGGGLVPYTFSEIFYPE